MEGRRELLQRSPGNVLDTMRRSRQQTLHLRKVRQVLTFPDRIDSESSRHKVRTEKLCSGGPS